MRGLVAAAYAAVSFLTFVWADAAAGNSATYQINSAHTGFVEFRNGLVPPLTKIWARDLGGDYTSYPVVANGLVFVTEDNTKGFGKNHTTLFAIAIHTGKIVWKKNIPGDNYFSNVAYENGKIFVLNGYAVLRAFTADADGVQLWRTTLPKQQFSYAAPTASGGQVFVTASADGVTLYAIDEVTGIVNWKTPALKGAGGSAATVGADGVYVTYDCQYYKFDTATGAPLWHADRGCSSGGGAHTPVYDRGNLYVRDDRESRDDWDVVVNAANGHIKQPMQTYATPAFWKNPAGGSLEFTRYNSYPFGNVYAANTRTGETVWSFSGDGHLSSAPIIVNDTLVVGSGTGELYLLDAATGEERWSTNVGAPIQFSGEQSCCETIYAGLGAGEDTLLIPASNLLAAYVSGKSRQVGDTRSPAAHFQKGKAGSQAASGSKVLG